MEDEEYTKSRIFICYWDCDGFEWIADFNDWERKSLLDAIRGNELSSPPVNLTAATMRARMNPQRDPEIWSFNTDYGVDEETLNDIAKTNPQELVDMIRKNGKRLYGSVPHKRVIT
jgi:hypothetical protein